MWGPLCFKINIRISVTWACVFVRADTAIIFIIIIIFFSFFFCLQ